MPKLYLCFTKSFCLKLSLFFLFTCFLQSAAVSQTGVLDQSFGNKGKVITRIDSMEFTIAHDVAVQADGKIVVVGKTETFNEHKIVVIRYHSNGSLDSSFASNGKLIYDVWVGDDAGMSVKIQPDGKILVGGYAHLPVPQSQASDADFFVFRLNTNGSFDNSFGNNGIVYTDIFANSSDILYSIELLPNGKILAGGFVDDITTFTQGYGITRYNANGSLDSSFGVNGIVYTETFGAPAGGSMRVQPDGKIVVASSTEDSTANVLAMVVARFLPNGTFDQSFGTNGITQVVLGIGDSYAYNLALQPDGKIIAVGETEEPMKTSIGLVRLTSTGALDNTFGNGGTVITGLSLNSDAATDVHVQPDGKIIVSGLENFLFDESNFALLRYNENGTLDNSFGRKGVIRTDFLGLGDESYASAIQPDGKIILVGGADDSLMTKYIAIARYERNAREYYNTLKGSAFVDHNRNGVKDAGEEFTSVQIVATKAGIDTISFVTTTTGFSGDIDTGSYTIRIASPLAYYNIVPAVHTVAHNTYFNTDSISFALQPIPAKRDIAINLIPITPARPGFKAQYAILYRNNGTDTIPAGTVEWIKSNQLNFIAASPAPSSISGDTLRWNYSNLRPLDTAVIILNVTIKAPPVVNVNDTIRLTSTILPAGTDLTQPDNTSALTQLVVGSYDPNDKMENHGGKIQLAQVQNGEYLQYMVRFQNTGTDTAFNVFIRDTLSNKLDYSSLQMIAASHPYELTINDGGKLLFEFNNINLLDSFRNEPASHGYIVYRIKPKTTLQPGEIIENTASIYFDFNLPVVTNTEKTVVVNEALPLTLLSFTATRHDKINKLEWTTTAEINVAHFIIERSENGRNFSSIGQVQAGNSRYQFTDANPVKGTNFYRLKMVDKDGSHQYSRTRTINNSGDVYVTAFPNPAKEVLRLQLTNDKREAIHIQVISLDGRVVLSRQLLSNTGTTIHPLDVSKLEHGTYFIRVTTATREQLLLKIEKL